MNGNCHFVFGAAVGTAIALNASSVAEVLPNIVPSSETFTLFVLGGLLGGIIPDIDNPISYIGKLTAPISTAIGKVSELFGKSGSNHRGILHDPIVYIAGLVLSYFYLPSLVGFFTGCLSHVFLDMFNPSGVPFLFGVKRLRLAKIPSGSKTGTIVTWISAVIVLIGGIVIKYIF